jgi:F-type H+-transporting ATPase subunit epsilon
MSSTEKRYLQVDIADVSQQIFSGRCASIVAPAALGEVCILPRHAPFLSKLIPGEVKILTEQDEAQFFYVSGGYMEVADSVVTVLADQMLRSSEIDREAALHAQREAEETLKKSHLFSERDQAKLQLVKALAQLRVLEHVDLTKLHKGRK